MSSFIPDTAPFNDEQRAWLNGFFSGLMGLQTTDQSFMAAGEALAQSLTEATADKATADESSDFPWHDAALPIADRMQLAADQPVQRKLMAAMAQLDCGTCGYLCKSYGEAIASGEEPNLTLCSPGGKETKQMIKKIVSESSQSAPAKSNGSTKLTDSSYTRKNPFTAKLLVSRPLNGEGSAKDTRHVVIDLTGSDLKYEVGDALGICPRNCDELASAIIRRLAADSQIKVHTPLGSSKSLADALSEDCCLKDPSDELLELLMGRISSDEHRQKLATMRDGGIAEGFDVLDALDIAVGATITATEFVETLSPLNPRLYSIASSMRHVGDQVHLTVGRVAYESRGRLRKGVASTMLAERIQPNESIRVFVQPNHGGFTVPGDPNTPMIMVGPGTGIAPFIAFLQERDVSASPGENWLFFGEQREDTDFLYQHELLAWRQRGLLTRLDTAFSRDGEKKVYVQDRMREHGSELWRWLNRGSHFYVCGDASRMAADVEKTLLEILSIHGGLRPEYATQYLQRMSKDKRYVRDVY